MSIIKRQHLKKLLTANAKAILKGRFKDFYEPFLFKIIVNVKLSQLSWEMWKSFIYLNTHLYIHTYIRTYIHMSTHALQIHETKAMTNIEICKV